MFNFRSHEQSYTEGVISVLNGTMQLRHYNDSKHSDVHPNYFRSKQYEGHVESRKDTRKIVIAAAAFRVLQMYGSSLHGRALGEVPYLEDEVDGFVFANGKPVTVKQLHIVRPLGKLSHGLKPLTRIMVDGHTSMTSTGREIIRDFPEQAFTVIPDSGIIHPATASKAHRIHELYEKNRDGDPSLLV